MKKLKYVSYMNVFVFGIILLFFGGFSRIIRNMSLQEFTEAFYNNSSLGLSVIGTAEQTFEFFNSLSLGFSVLIILLLILTIIVNVLLMRHKYLFVASILLLIMGLLVLVFAKSILFVFGLYYWVAMGVVLYTRVYNQNPTEKEELE